MAGTGPRRKLIEAALPLAAIGRHAAREGQGGTSPLHLWWSHKPAAACRAVLFASLVDDPADRLPGAEADRERVRLLDLTARLCDPGAIGAAALVEARRVLAAAHAGGLPTICDPFCGSGAIPAEAARLGLPVRASDLNPVAVLATQALIAIPTRFAGLPAIHPAADPRLTLLPPAPETGMGLAAGLRFYGARVRDEAERRIGHCYPPAPGGEPVIAWLWGRTATCPNPACGAEMPLVSSFWLSRRPGREVWVLPTTEPGRGLVRCDIATAGDGTPEPPVGTYSDRSAYCLTCRSPVPLPTLRQAGRETGLGLRLIAIVAKARRGRRYLPPDPEHERLALAAVPPWAPETELPARALGISAPSYGLARHRDLYTPRQLLALATFSEAIRAVRPEVEADARRGGLADDDIALRDGGRGACAYAEAVVTYLACALDRAAAKWCTLARWQRSRENIEHPFASPGLAMTWDFAEANPFSPATGNWLDAVEAVADALGRAPVEGPAAACRQLDAATVWDAARPEGNGAGPDPAGEAGTRGQTGGPLVFCTDPPYFANMPYADTADLFYVWLRPTLGDVFPDLFRTVLTPKAGELVADPNRFGGRVAARDHFLAGMRAALAAMRAQAHPDYPVTIFYALRQGASGTPGPGAAATGAAAAEGWEAMLESLLAAGLQLTGTWPLRTEHAGRRRTLGSNALASSILLVCRPRPAGAPDASLGQVLRELRGDMARATAELTAGGVDPVDLAQAAIGPGMAVFSRYARVLGADGRPVPVAAMLALINQELDACLASEDTELDPASRFCLTWFEQFGFEARPYGEADVLARARNTGVDALTRSGALSASGGRARLTRPSELPARHQAAAGDGAWLALQHVARALEQQGEPGAAEVLAGVDRLVAGTLRGLAYRLFAAAERRGLAEEARTYGAVAAAWDRIATRARRPGSAGRLPGV